MSQNANGLRPTGSIPDDKELLTAVPRGKVRREFQVGIFVIMGALSVLIALFLLTDPSTFRGRYVASTLVADAGGIRKGDPVQMKGVNVGRVHGFELTPEGVLIGLEMEGEWEVPLDSRTRLVSSGIMGGKTVDIIPGTSSRVLGNGDQLMGENLPGLLDFPPELGQNAQDVLVRIRDLLSEPTVEAVQNSAEELQGLLAQLSSMAAAQEDELARFTESLTRTAQGLEGAVGSGEDIQSVVAKADSTLLTIEETSASFLRASSSLEVILARMEAGEGTLGQLSTDATLYDSLTEAIQSFHALAEDIKAHPGRYVKVEIF